MTQDETETSDSEKRFLDSLKEWKIPLTALFLLVVPIAAIIVYSKMSQSGRDEQKSIDACLAGVKSELLSPTSAEFSLISTSPADGGTWDVSGYVDAANFYGTKLHHNFVCVAVHPASGIAENVKVG